MTEFRGLIEQNTDRFLDELFEFLKIPSVSADPARASDVRLAAQFVVQHLNNLGVDTAEIWETDGFPVVYAEKIVSPSLPTVLIYGHYDVQPPDPLHLWHSDPFTPVVRDGKIYARGAADDKGQVFMYLKALELMNELPTLPVNLKFFIEGEEEIGSENLYPTLKKYQDRLACNAILISDTSMISMDTPSLTVGLRGLSYMEVEVTGPNHDLHSGVFGGAVANPANVLCQLITSLHDSERRVTIPGFYDDVLELTLAEREAMARAPFNLNDFKAHLGIRSTLGESGYSVTEHTSIRPTLDVNGIWSGYTGEGSKTVLPSKAYAKISMRLVPNQSAEKISHLFEQHFRAIAPDYVEVAVKYHHGGQPFVTDSGSKAYQAAELAIEQVFGQKPIPTREGGSIPILAFFQETLQQPIVLMGFGLNTDAIHSPNEHYGVLNFQRGIESIIAFCQSFARISK